VHRIKKVSCYRNAERIKDLEQELSPTHVSALVYVDIRALHRAHVPGGVQPVVPFALPDIAQDPGEVRLQSVEERPERELGQADPGESCPILLLFLAPGMGRALRMASATPSTTTKDHDEGRGGLYLFTLAPP